MSNKYLKGTFLYKILRPIISFCFKILFNPKIVGQENVLDKNIILAGNHTSNLDCLLLISSTKRQIHYLAKKELWKYPQKIIFSNLGLIPVDRKKKNKEALELAYKYLRNNEVIGIFPEGTTEKGSGLLPFKMGAVKIASVTNSKIVPFIITGKYRVFYNNLKLEFLKPIKITDDLVKENKNLRNMIKNKLEGEL